MQQHGSKYFARRPPPPPHDPWGRVKIQLFQNMVMLHIKLNGITNVANIFSADPGGWDQNSTFSEYGHVSYQIKGNNACSNMVANILPACYDYTLRNTFGGNK